MTTTETQRRPAPSGIATADRATSTTLDVTLCLLLVSAAIGVLAAAGPPATDHHPATADHAAERLTTTTHAVTYHPVASSGGRADAQGPGEPGEAAARQRTVHGTLATLLARAAIADVAGREHAARDGTAREHVSRDAPASAYERAIRSEVRRAVADLSATVNVTATYAPIANASALAVPGSGGRSSDAAANPIVGRASAGPTPPADVDVTVVHVQVPVGARATTADVGATRAFDADGFAALANATASATLATVLPADRTTWGARDGATSTLVGARFGALADRVGVDVGDALANGNLERARQRLRDALAERFASQLRSRFDSPRPAERAVNPTVVTITVRTWSP